MAITPKAGYIIDPNNPNGVIPDTLTSINLSSNTPLQLASTPVDNTNYNSVISSAPDFNSIISSIYNSTASELNVNKNNSALDKLTTDITNAGGSVNSSGEIDTSFASRLKNEDFLKKFGYTGSADAFKQFQDINNEITRLKNEAIAIPLEVQKEFTGTLATRSDVAPIQTARLRDNAIRTLTSSSLAQAIQGNIQTASSLAKDAVDIEFAPLQARLNAEMFNYQRNKDVLEREDMKKAQALEINLNERARILEEQKIEKKSISDIGLKLAEYGVDTTTINSVLGAKNINEAISLAGSKLRDPAQIAELENIRLNDNLTKLKIQKEIEDINILKTYGGLTPAQWLEQQKTQREELAKTQKDKEQANKDALTLDQNIRQVDTILGSGALNTIIGPTFLNRGVARQKGVATTIASALTGGLGIGSLYDEATRADDTVGLIQQIVDKQFLDELVNVKAKGATFGALTDKEGQALRNAGTAISNSVIERDGKVIGYDMSEKEFKNQLNIIKTNMLKAYEKATGKIFTTDESSQLDNFFPTEQNPLDYYN
jgi:hypothetical protein